MVHSMTRHEEKVCVMVTQEGGKDVYLFVLKYE